MYKQDPYFRQYPRNEILGICVFVGSKPYSDQVCYMSNFNILIFVSLALTNTCYNMLVHDDGILDRSVGLIFYDHEWVWN